MTIPELRPTSERITNALNEVQAAANRLMSECGSLSDLTQKKFKNVIVEKEKFDVLEKVWFYNRPYNTEDDVRKSCYSGMIQAVTEDATRYGTDSPRIQRTYKIVDVNRTPESKEWYPFDTSVREPHMSKTLTGLIQKVTGEHAKIVGETAARNALEREKKIAEAKKVLGMEETV